LGSNRVTPIAGKFHQWAFLLALMPPFPAFSNYFKISCAFGIKFAPKILINKEFHYLCHPKNGECSFM